MLNSGKNFALCATKKNILTLVLSEKKIMNETKTITPLQVKWSVPKALLGTCLQVIFPQKFCY